MSVSSFDSEDFDPCEVESNLSMPMSTTSSPTEAESFVPLEASQVVHEGLTTLESLVPLINDLPGLTLENQVYYATQPLSNTERDALLFKASSVVDITLTEQSGSGKLSAGVFMTLAKAQPNDGPLFPSLKHLRLKNAGSYLNYLNLFLGPSLESLEIGGVSDIHEESLLSFLKAAAVQLPHLKSLVLKDGHISLATLPSYLELRNLQSLTLFTCPPSFDVSFFKAIGSLPSLEEFVFKPAQEHTYHSTFVTKKAVELAGLNATRCLAQVNEKIHNLEVEADKLRNREECVRAQYKEVEMVLSQLELTNCRLSSSTSTSESDQSCLRATMLQKQNLHGVPSSQFDSAMTLISALGLEQRITRSPGVKSRQLLTRIIRDKLFAPLEADNNVPAEPDSPTTLEALNTALAILHQRRDGIIANEIGLEVGAPNPPDVAISSATNTTGHNQHEADTLDQAMPPLFSLLRVVEVSASVGLIVDLIGAIEAPAIQRLSLTIDTPLSDSAGVREVELEARTNILQTLEKWQRTFKAVSLAISGHPSVVQNSLFSALLHSPEIEQIDLSGFEVADIDSSLDNLSTAVPSKLHHLHISCQPSSTPGLSLSRLRQIAEACPDLVSLQCRFENLADVRQYTLGEAAADPMSHKLRVLNVGNTEAQLDPGVLLHVARYLDVLFPHLESIEPFHNSSENVSQWKFVGDMVKAFHSARLDEVARAKTRCADGA